MRCACACAGTAFRARQARLAAQHACAAHPCRYTDTSTFTMSPSCSGRRSGMPWQMTCTTAVEGSVGSGTPAVGAPPSPPSSPPRITRMWCALQAPPHLVDGRAHRLGEVVVVEGRRVGAIPDRRLVHLAGMPGVQAGGWQGGNDESCRYSACESPAQHAATQPPRAPRCQSRRWSRPLRLRQLPHPAPAALSDMPRGCQPAPPRCAGRLRRENTRRANKHAHGERRLCPHQCPLGPSSPTRCCLLSTSMRG